jgi:hypothetical protein
MIGSKKNCLAMFVINGSYIQLYFIRKLIKFALPSVINKASIFYNKLLQIKTLYQNRHIQSKSIFCIFVKP